MNHHEDKEQELVFKWASYIPACRRMFAIPNGANLAGDKKAAAIQMSRLKRQGLRPGVSDIFLPYPNRGKHGLFIEMKRRKVDGRSKPTEEQSFFQEEMRKAGYEAVICYGADEAIAVIRRYIGMAT